jgi:hypothetical protein
MVSNQFAVLIDCNSDYKFNLILKAAKKAGLTISGDGTNYTRHNNAPIGYTKEEDVLLFGTEDRFDVIRSTQKYALQNYKKISAYSLDSDTYDIIEAITEFGSTKRRLAAKYPVNNNGYTLYTMSLLENKHSYKNEPVLKKERKQVSEDITVTPDWIRVGTKFISKNTADTVVIKQGTYGNITIPGYYGINEYIY